MNVHRLPPRALFSNDSYSNSSRENNCFNTQIVSYLQLQFHYGQICRVLLKCKSLCNQYGKLRSLLSVRIIELRLFEFQVTRICDRILKNSTNWLPDCASTGRDCITYSRNKIYAYKCNETYVSQDREGEDQCEESLQYHVFKIKNTFNYMYLY